MKNKIISFLSASILVFLFSLPNISMARPGFAGGDGSEGNPYQITTCEQLQIVTYYATEESYFILNNDIDCSMTSTSNSDGEGGYYGFMPIGYTYDTNTETGYGDNFVGHFDGNNHTISGLYINRPTYDYVGLFGRANSATISNVFIVDVSIIGHDNVGGLMGYSLWSHIENTYSTGNVTGNDYVGGLVGMNSDGILTILNSHSTVETVGNTFIGGLVGMNQSSSVINSYATGNVSGESFIGGLVGINVEGSNIKSSYATGDVECNTESSGDLISCGGLVGLNEGSHIENTFATGDVSGFVAGGLVGQSLDKTIVNSYATGDVTGSIVGGLIGYLYGDFVYNSYSIGKITTVPNEMIGEIFDQDHFGGGLIGVLVYYEGESADNYVFNSGWYKSEENSGLSGIGMTGYFGESPVYEGSVETTYTESDPTAFYSSNHDIYKNAVEYDWEFNGNPWYEYSDDYPKFTEPDSNSKPSHSRVRSSGSSVGAISTFYQEQYQRALAVGADTTPYQEALNNLNPNTTTSPDTNHRTLKQGMQGDDVKQLQIYLNTHNYPLATQGPGSPNNETTYFGNKTKQAVILFQKANNLTPDGVVGPLTWSYIK